MSDTYNNFINHLQEISVLNSVGSALHWDMETQMPPQAAEFRARQMSMLARMGHEQFTSPRIGEWLSELESSELVKDVKSTEAVNIREVRRSYDRAVKLPGSLVEEISKTAALAHQAWVDARKKSDFKTFSPWLSKIIDLRKQEATCIGGPNLYDTLLDEYEPGETSANLKRVFADLRNELVPLVGAIIQSGKVAPIDIVERPFPIDAQKSFVRLAAEKIGFDFNAGRLDVSVHPFCTELGPRDTRMTTRYDERGFSDAFFGVLHESGHGLYDQGLPAEHYGTPRGSYISLGIHESQSRMWENLVGRSRAFWEYFWPEAQKAFPQTLNDVYLDSWLFAINDVRPSFIRVEADEATYNLHILLRFELESALLSGELPVNDLPGEWNSKMQKYFGLTPPDDARGCLQDTHWSGGAVGYFPTYTLGNLYAAQFFEQANKDLGHLDTQFAKGEFAPLLNWLRQNIHTHGKTYHAPELVKKITGRELSITPLITHLRKKATDYYGVK